MSNYPLHEIINRLVFDKTEIFNFIDNSIYKNSKSKIVYAHAATLLSIKKNNKLKDVFDKADLIYADGTGVYFANRLLGIVKAKHRFNWTDSVYSFLELCEKKEWSIYFIGSIDEFLINAKNNLCKQFPNLKIVGQNHGYFKEGEDIIILDDISKCNPDIVWVGMGSPKQEFWINENFEKLTASVIMSVGDIFTYLAGGKKRGPKIVRKFGFEWLIRFVYNPLTYFKRYIIGIPQFLYLILILYLKEKFNKSAGEGSENI